MNLFRNPSRFNAAHDNEPNGGTSMSRMLGRVLIWIAEALDRNLILVPDLDEADA
jgi:hypothetical protein